MSFDLIKLRQINPVLPTVYDGSLSYLESLGKVAEKCNEIIETLNIIQPDKILEELEELKEYVDNVVQSLTDTVNNKLNENLIQVIALLDATIKQVNESLEENLTDTKQLINNAVNTVLDYLTLISVNVTSKDERTGKRIFLDRALDISYDLNRLVAYTAKEYDDLSLSCSAFNDFQLTAFEYDVYGKYYFPFYRTNAIKWGGKVFPFDFFATSSGLQLYNNVVNVTLEGIDINVTYPTNKTATEIPQSGIAGYDFNFFGLFILQDGGIYYSDDKLHECGEVAIFSQSSASNSGITLPVYCQQNNNSLTFFTLYTPTNLCVNKLKAANSTVVYFKVKCHINNKIYL